MFFFIGTEILEDLFRVREVFWQEKIRHFFWETQYELYLHKIHYKIQIFRPKYITNKILINKNINNKILTE